MNPLALLFISAWHPWQNRRDRNAQGSEYARAAISSRQNSSLREIWTVRPH